MLRVQCIKSQGAEKELTIDKVYNIGLNDVNDKLIYITSNDVGAVNVGYDRDKFKYVVRR